MEIGIVANISFKKRTGVEEYVYQILKHLPKIDDYKSHHFFLLAPYNLSKEKISAGYTLRFLKWPFRWGWTQIRLSWEMFKNKPDILFVPVHTFPFFCPKLIVVVQGLEYERVPKCYSFLQRKKLRFITKRNTKKAKKIIVPSECTKKDLIELYKINPKKIFVIPHGISKNKKQKIKNKKHKLKIKNYILYLGSSHKRKNIKGLIDVFKILREKYKIEQNLILAGVKNMEYSACRQADQTSHINGVLVKDYVSEDEKWQLLKNADVFVWPSFYEGFGFPVLEAQLVGLPVVASNTGSLPEILENSALLVDSNDAEKLAEAIYKVLSDGRLRNELIRKSQENIKRFSWEKCVEKTLSVIINL